MAQTDPTQQPLQVVNAQTYDIGGLRFGVSFRGEVGATLRVNGRVNDEWKELLRFDDFVDTPHYHVPADAPQIDFDRATYGDPLEWYLLQIRDHLPQLLISSGFADVVPSIDMAEVVSNIPTLRDAMHACLTEGFVRLPGVGLQRVNA